MLSIFNRNIIPSKVRSLQMESNPQISVKTGRKYFDSFGIFIDKSGYYSYYIIDNEYQY
jgi:hypothetical protein